MNHLWPVFLFLIPFCLVGHIEQGGPICLFIPAFASVLLGWYLGRREGAIL